MTFILNKFDDLSLSEINLSVMATTFSVSSRTSSVNPGWLLREDR
jgi:hypothetical protein